jgi:hypothetical protein
LYFWVVVVWKVARIVGSLAAASYWLDNGGIAAK